MEQQFPELRLVSTHPGLHLHVNGFIRSQICVHWWTVQGTHRVSTSWAAFLLCLFPVQKISDIFLLSAKLLKKKRNRLRTRRGEASVLLIYLFSFLFLWTTDWKPILLYIWVKLNFLKYTRPLSRLEFLWFAIYLMLTGEWLLCRARVSLNIQRTELSAHST